MFTSGHFCPHLDIQRQTFPHTTGLLKGGVDRSKDISKERQLALLTHTLFLRTPGKEKFIRQTENVLFVIGLRNTMDACHHAPPHTTTTTKVLGFLLTANVAAKVNSFFSRQ
jgi:hypothetical protein